MRPDEERFLSIRSLMARWDCSRTSVSRELDRMRRLGIYSGTHIAGPRVALSAVEGYERYREHQAMAGPSARATTSHTPPTGAFRGAAAKQRRAPSTTVSSSTLLATFLAAARGPKHPPKR